MAKAATKTRITKKQVIAHRTKAPKDHSPTWDDAETLTADEFSKKFRNAMDYYRLEFNGKDLKPAVIKWMTSVGCTKEDIAAFKKTKDKLTAKGVTKQGNWLKDDLRTIAQKNNLLKTVLQD